MKKPFRYPTTPDVRYFVVRGRLWRCANPALSAAARDELVHDLMSARRAVRTALAAKDSDALAASRRSVDKAKVGLGERGAVWWSDDSPDVNGRMVRNTPYADWFAGSSETRE
ncbi:hypothetical protein E4341_11975 [Brevundimonas sp. 'scallop']|nr:hypothetical protein E4341_11975 [Brevundimonas sp. 'scallop']